jgi:hypothetical protein
LEEIKRYIKKSETSFVEEQRIDEVYSNERGEIFDKTTWGNKIFSKNKKRFSSVSF